MKTKNLIERLSLFLLALVLTMPTWAQGTEVVSISSAADWKTFCQRVNDNGEPFLNAKLTQDVDLGGEIVMLGSVSYPYSGTFDGNGHTLKFNWNAGKDDRIAPFKYVKDATIKNLRTQGKITKKGYGLSGMVYIALGTTTISGCISDVDITGGDAGWNDSQAAGMVQAVGYQASVHITDCLVKGSITDNADESYKAMAGFVFSNSGTYTLTRCLYVGKNNATNNGLCKTFGKDGYGATFTDCYYLNTCGKVQGDKITEAQLKNGYVAYKLQKGIESQVWGQTLGTDNEPQPTTEAAKRVYKVAFNYNGREAAVRYANNGQGIHGTLPTAKDLLGNDYNPKLTYALNFGNFTATTPVTADKSVDVTVTVSGTFPIATAADWKEFCQRVNGGETAINAKLMNDVDLGEEIVMVGNYDKMYSGTFDGQGHTLKFNWNRSDKGNLAPFRYVKDATIKNLRTQGKITSKGDGLSGMVLAALGTTTLTGCVSDVEITGGGGRYGSESAGMVQTVYGGASVTITDCLVKGSLTDNADEDYRMMAGFVFYNGGTYTLTRCLYVGTNNASYNGHCFTFGYDGGTFTLTDCYYLKLCGNVRGDKVTAERLKSGEMAKLLQGDRTENVWGQTLGTDLEPLPTTDATKRVYEVKFTYNGEVKATRYATNGQSIHGGLPTAQDLLGTGYNPHHYYAIAFADGFNASTTVTADRQVTVSITEKDCYEISTKADWKAFCGVVNNGVTAVDAKLTADVNLGTEVVWVGDNYNQYGGTFDGQGHTLSFDWTSQGDPTPFYFVDGATIKNLRTKGKITTSGGEASGLLGNAYGTTTISNCVSDVEITSSIDWDACEAAGLVQTVAYNGKVTVTDCVVKGNINATTEKGRKGMAGFVYTLYDGGTCTLTNCLYVGKNNGTENSYTFAPAGITLNNCYYLNACGKAQGDKITEAQLKNGYVAHKLQGDRTDNVWGQTLGTDDEPMLTTEKAKHVYKVDFKYMDEVKATRYANSGGRVKLPTAKELLGADYDAQKSYTLTFENGFSETTAINGDITVSVTVNVVTGIDGVTNDDSTVRGAVYNLQGVRVAESSDAETLRRLPAGVYIVKGKKFVVR